MAGSVRDFLTSRRPDRADAARNFDAILIAARAAFVEDGTEIPLADIARRAGVGVATLFRHFPTREDLVEAVYVDEVDAVCQSAAELAATAPPKEALSEWIRRFINYMATKQVLLAALDRESGAFLACRRALYDSAAPLLATAQSAGAARKDVDIDDVLRFLMGVTAAPSRSDEQRERMIRLAVSAVATSSQP